MFAAAAVVIISRIFGFISKVTSTIHTSLSLFLFHLLVSLGDIFCGTSTHDKAMGVINQMINQVQEEGQLDTEIVEQQLREAFK